jgi:hypothetical protein
MSWRKMSRASCLVESFFVLEIAQIGRSLGQTSLLSENAGDVISSCSFETMSVLHLCHPSELEPTLQPG